eukprot:CAMPEP_0206235828 /NCGR_PEP_ID=MMETSP0047_2-20121206/13372_1 /ASSEMBLY_ACC=CAM_ASM_000192 /TAXON_ID=195065 /ORGANISM="Chroomonas mesostigmatica_cf, Strain CCMP1168" /LENGTH=574 /DNA_ID=CAMNT_0053660087 /DNA_START=184 /DNA_END=1905 /DNA_ORIENTATION=+
MVSWIKDNDFVNEFLFAAPTPSTFHQKSFPGDLVWLDDGQNGKFPCLFLPKEGASCCLCYLHGNAEDLGLSHDLLKCFRDFLNVHVIGVEYPGYGPVPGNPCEGGVNRHTRAAFNFIIQKLRIPPQRVIIFGRSVGTGPACNLVSLVNKSKKQVGALVLQSPYRSIRTLAKDLVGALGNVIMDRFDNESAITSCTAPTLIIHGRQDELIPVKHASVLYEKCGAEAKCLEIIDGVDHNAFHALEHIVRPMSTFMQKIGLDRLPPLPLTSFTVMQILDDNKVLVPPDIPEPRGSVQNEPGFVVRALGSLLGKNSDWDDDQAGEAKPRDLHNHKNVGVNKPSAAPRSLPRFHIPKTAADAKEKGNAALANGCYDEACVLYSCGIAFDPTSHVMYSNRSAAHAHMRRFGKARDSAAQCVELAPDWWKGYVRFGQAVEMVDGAASAFDVYMRGVRLSPGNPKLEGKLSEVYTKSLGRKAELQASGLSEFAVGVAQGHAEAMLDLLHAVLRRDWAHVHDIKALTALFPCPASSLKAWKLDVPGMSLQEVEVLKGRALFLRSVDAALECLLVFFGMESTLE